MKIKELIARLNELDPELDVVVGYKPRDPQKEGHDKSSVKEVKVVWAPAEFAIEEPLYVELKTNADYPSRQQRSTSK